MNERDRLDHWAIGSAATFGGVLAVAIVSLLCWKFRIGWEYANALFLGLPFLQGFTTSCIFESKGPMPFRNHLLADLAGVTVAGFMAMLFVTEGGICIAMAAPLAFLVMLFGSGLAKAVMNLFHGRQGPASVSLAVVLPYFLLADHVGSKIDERVTSTTIVISASPEQIWPYLSRLEAIPSSGFWMFEAGVAHPIRTQTFDGKVGGRRQCILTTGAMNEVITDWKPPRFLRFRVLNPP